MSETEFKSFAERLATRVDLFQAIWSKDASAELYGGTVRDYLFWVRSQVLTTGSRAHAERAMNKLLSKPFIKAREFLYADSDVDALATEKFYLDPIEFGIRAIDIKSKDVFDATTVKGQDELKQGHLPIEKMRLSREGFRETPGLGGGFNEVYSGRRTVHFADPKEFATTSYARKTQNHQILLVLRYLRLLALGYYREFGAGYPDLNLILSAIDAETDQRIKAIVAEIKRPSALKKYFAQDNFVHWFNGSIQKSFRAYTNPTAAMLLMKHYGLDDLPNIYPQVTPMNQYLFGKAWDPARRDRALAEYGVHAERLYAPVTAEFADGFLYHGTRTEESFRNILIEGVLPSTQGLAGQGLYGVDAGHLKITETYATYRELLIQFKVKPNAKIVDITAGEGRRAWQRFARKYGENYENFCELFNIDILRYPYHDAHAFVVKNSLMLERGNGVYRPVLPLGELMERAEHVTDPIELMILSELNGLTKAEQDTLWAYTKLKETDLVTALQDPSVLARVLIMKSTPLTMRAYAHLRAAQQMTGAIAGQFFDALSGSSSEGDMRMLVNLIEHDNATLTPEQQNRLLDVLMSPALIERNGFYDLSGMIGKLAPYIARSTTDEFKLRLFPYLQQNRILGHIWVRGKGLSNSEMKSPAAQREFGEFLFRAAQVSQGSDLDEILYMGRRGRYPRLLELVEHGIAAGTPGERAAALNFFETGVLTPQTVRLLIAAVQNEPAFRIRGLKALAESKVPLDRVDVENLRALAAQSTGPARGLVLRILSRSYPSREASPEWLKQLSERALNVPMLFRLPFYAPNEWAGAFSDNGVALEMLERLATNGNAPAEAIALRMLENRWTAKLLIMEYRYPLRHQTSLPILKKYLSRVATAELTRKFIMGQIRFARLSPEMTNALHDLLDTSGGAAKANTSCEANLATVTR